MRRAKHSIARQIAGIFIGVMAFLLIANVAANGFFLEQYYISRFKNVLKSAYIQMDQHSSAEGLERNFFEGELARISQRNNMDLVIVDENYRIIYGTVEGITEIMAGRIWGYTMGTDLEQAEVLSKNENYTIQKKYDRAVELDYLEMWGKLNNEYRFMMRIPLQNIAVNVHISNEFLVYFCVIALIVSTLLIMLVSKKIAKPINELTVLSKRMAELDFDAKYEGRGSNEIDELGEHFNEMSEKLEQTISQLKTANNELQRDIERKNRIDDMRKEFLSNVSHELKTPLALIQGYAEGLEEGIGDDEESRNYYCEVSRDEAAKMNVMVQKLLTLNELEFGQEQVNMERIDLSAMICSSVQAAGILAQQKNAAISFEGEQMLHAWGNSFQVEEVLTNYLSNACNHVLPNGSIIVSACREERVIRISVFNEGNPIPEKDIDRIWEKFYKVDKARTREYGGSGVGLSIVKAIMEGMHQSYGAENVPGGVRFWFTLENADGGSTL